MQKHLRQMRLRQFIPFIFVLSLMGSSLTAPFSLAGKLILLLVAGCYILANLLASISVARQNDWRSLRLLPGAFVTLHLAYGLGFLVGLFRFWNRWFDRETSSTHSKAQAKRAQQA